MILWGAKLGKKIESLNIPTKVFLKIAVKFITFALKKYGICQHEFLQPYSLMKIFTGEEIRNIDKYTIENDGVTSMQLIERMAEAATAEITTRWRQSKQVVVFAGSGNNGADALAIARRLGEQGYKVHVYLFNIGGNKLSPECAECRDLLKACPNVGMTEVINSFMLPELPHTVLIIDGLFGNGLREPLREGYAYLVQRINEVDATVVSLDVPSGLSSDWNPRLVSRDIIHATLTLAVQYPRLSFFIADNADLVGEWKALDIGLSQEAARKIPVKYYLVEAADVYHVLRRRKPFSSKADYGSMILYAGSYGMFGSAVLAAKGALRAGVGKVTVDSPKSGMNILQTAVPEALYSYNPGQFVMEKIHPQHHYNAIGIGPGIGTEEQTITALEEFLSTMKQPVVLDADALNCIAKKPTLLNFIPVMSILTPHAGEFDRLFGSCHNAEARLQRACEVAKRYNIIIVLKGHYTAIVRPDGKIYFNSSGTPAMATPGSGDVLTGMLTAFLAQQYKPEIASLLAVYIHGLAGEIAAETNGEYGVTAGDIADNVGRAITMIMND